MTANGKKTVCLVGFAPTSRHLAPYDDPDIEVWGINEAYWYNFMGHGEGETFVPRWDRWVQIHQRWDFGRGNNSNHPEHLQWLKGEPYACRCDCHIGLQRQLKESGMACPACKRKWTEDRFDLEEENWTKMEVHEGALYLPPRRTDFPIYMQEAHDDIPGSVKFPLDEIKERFLKGRLWRRTRDDDGNVTGLKPFDYFTSSFAYMCSLALLEGFERILVFGFEMATDTEYRYQKGSTEFWLGVAAEMGVEVVLEEECQLLKGGKYAYEVSQMINRQELEGRLRMIKGEREKSVGKLNAVSGAKQEVLRLHISTMQAANELKQEEEPNDSKIQMLVDMATAYRERANELFQEELNIVNQANAIVGAQTEIEYLIAHIDCKFTNKEEEERGVPKPFFRPQAKIEEITVTPLEATDDAGTETTEADEGTGTSEDDATVPGTA